MREKLKTKEVYELILSICSKQNGETIEIAAADNGPGIPDDYKNKILQPFFTTKKGTEGIGLSITNNIIKGHGGNITIGSREGEGSTFTVTLPGVSAS